jgi:hypothetical protein
VAFWVGLGGDPTYPLYQAGSGAFCQNGVPVHALWYEVMTPANPAPLMKVHRIAAGDAVGITVTLGAGSTSGDIHLVDATIGWSADIVFTPAGPPPTTAEWVTEAPAFNGQVSPLANFTPVTFHDCSANQGSESLATWPTSQLTEMTLRDDSGGRATPGAIAPETPATSGGDFTVTYGP